MRSRDVGGSRPTADRGRARHSGRVGRTAAARQLEPEALDLAVRAYVRHARTPHDELLGRGWERHGARSAVAGEIEEVLDRWRRPRHDGAGA